MILMARRKLEIPKKYLYLTALLFSAAVVIQIISSEANPTLDIYVRHIVLFSSIYLFWAIVADFINNLIQPFSIDRPKLTQVLERFFSAVILVLINLFLTNLLYYTLLIIFLDFTVSESYQDFQPYILKSIIIRFVDILIIGLVLKTIDTYQTVQKQKLKVISLENQLNKSQLEALRNQLDPHFLFNTLHTLNTLIGYNDKKAQSMVIKVTNLLRKILEKREKQMISFQEELEYFSNYLEIEEERFHDRLELDIQISEETHDILVPNLLLQPLIENAFKHGISKLEGVGVIQLKANRFDHIFEIELSNSISKSNLQIITNSTKLGLENLKNRLAQAYADHHSLVITKDDDMFKIKISIHNFKTL